ncbi:hypothetical protein DPMN_122771 [Dreissena polymorpha]|uniref:Uncharacterized protein n=1 Tax=Dreissena polymorpha TaxID=45954 RepID=A0A9D4JQV9_DREPO|nr:hypothetical protein DPMN_122771 [Dreissena polymorpha]
MFTDIEATVEDTHKPLMIQQASVYCADHYNLQNMSTAASEEPEGAKSSSELHKARLVPPGTFTTENRAQLQTAKSESLKSQQAIYPQYKPTEAYKEIEPLNSSTNTQLLLELRAAVVSKLGQTYRYDCLKEKQGLTENSNL